MLSGKIKQSGETSILEAANLLKNGQLIVFPTETVYGIGTDAENEEAINRLYKIKGRDRGKPLQILVENMEMARNFGLFNELAEKLAQFFWPGPLTLVVERVENCPISANLSPGSKTLGIRIPAHETALKLLRLFGKPMASTSANFSGMESSVNALEAAGSVGSFVPFVIDGGRSALSVSSTVVDVTGIAPQILREGAISEVEINDAVANPHSSAASSK